MTVLRLSVVVSISLVPRHCHLEHGYEAIISMRTGSVAIRISVSPPPPSPLLQVVELGMASNVLLINHHRLGEQTWEIVVPTEVWSQFLFLPLSSLSSLHISSC